MESKEELRLHICFVLLFAVSFGVDPMMEKLLPWNPPQVSFFALAVGLLWATTFCILRLRIASDQMKVLNDRVERLERKIKVLEADDDAQIENRW